MSIRFCCILSVSLLIFLVGCADIPEKREAGKTTISEFPKSGPMGVVYADVGREMFKCYRGYPAIHFISNDGSTQMLLRRVVMSPSNEYSRTPSQERDSLYFFDKNGVYTSEQHITRTKAGSFLGLKSKEDIINKLGVPTHTFVQAINYSTGKRICEGEVLFYDGKLLIRLDNENKKATGIWSFYRNAVNFDPLKDGNTSSLFQWEEGK